MLPTMSLNLRDSEKNMVPLLIFINKVGDNREVEMWGQWGLDISAEVDIHMCGLKLSSYKILV